MHLKRAKFKQDIIAEWLPPSTASNKVVIFCEGCPGLPGNKKVQELFSSMGFWSFYPRYRGTWESEGKFLAQSPYQDITDVIDSLEESFADEWSGEVYTIPDPEIYVVGMSFGGPAAIFASAHPKVIKAVALAPVVHWPDEEKSPDEPMSWLGGAIQKSFGNAYRFDMQDWNRLARGEFYNPKTQTSSINPEKLMIVHAKDDSVVLYESVAAFAQDIGCCFISKKRGGHLGSSQLRSWWFRRPVMKFINS